MKTPIPASMPLAQELYHFWFEEPREFSDKIALWFGGTPEVDEKIRIRYEQDVIRAQSGEFDHWQEHPQACLALILLLDQFPLNIYRDQAKSFEFIARALPISKTAVARGYDRGFTVFERLFLYLPYEHSELMSDQHLSMELFTKLRNDAKATNDESLIRPAEVFYDFALKHFEVMERFGRYPDRNAILGRDHTAQEADYMAAGGPPF